MTSTQVSAACASLTEAPATVLIGLDDKQKRHASYFTADQTEPALAAAQLMGMASLPVTDDAIAALARKLPKGKIFNRSGKAFVPYVGAALFDQIAAHLPDASILGALRAAASAIEIEAAASKSKNYRLPQDWSGFQPNDLVLATEGGEMDGWFECVVQQVKPDGALLLGWRDWPEEPVFERLASEVALMWSSPPSAAQAN